MIRSQFLIQLIRIELLHLAVLHLLLRAHRLLLLHLLAHGRLLLHGWPVVRVALYADEEITLLAEVQVGCLVPAEVALAGRLEIGQSEGVFVVAGFQGNGSALEAIAFSLLTAVHTTQFDTLFPLAHHTVVVPIIRTRYIDQHVIFVALESDGPLFVGCNCAAVLDTRGTQPHPALPIITVLIMLLATSHTPELMFLWPCRLSSHDIMFMRTGIIEIDIHQLATNTVTPLAVRAVPRTLLHFSAKTAECRLVHSIHEGQHVPARTLSVYVGNKLSRFRLIEVVRQFTVAVLTDTKIAETVIIYSVLADCRAHSADITDKVEIGDLLERKGVADRTPFLSTGGHSTSHTVQLTTDAAI